MVKSKEISKATSQRSKAKSKPKLFYYFGGGKAEGRGDMKDTLGGKGAGLAEMTNIKIPVPPGFTITTDACHMYYKEEMTMPDWFEKDMKSYMAKIEKQMVAGFGDAKKPLLVSVRSGAKFSMPGMMDTVLNLGLNEETLEGIIEKSGNARFAHDNYRRFISMFGNVVLGIDKDLFEDVIQKKKKDKKIKQDSSLQVKDLQDIVKRFKQIMDHVTKPGTSFNGEPVWRIRLRFIFPYIICLI